MNKPTPDEIKSMTDDLRDELTSLVSDPTDTSAYHLVWELLDDLGKILEELA